MDAATCLVMLSLCTSIDYSVAPPADFPQLEIRVHEFDGLAAGAACEERYAKLGRIAPRGIVACAHIDFARETCDILVPRGVTYFYDYERAKCRGYGSKGEPATSAQQWRAWRERQAMREPGAKQFAGAP